ncbi:MAG: thiol peroxidase [Holophagaceae bacterium]|uniref:Thiol peroxidase n=1 Tax=Candidatus Geothrix skivensis TaxID=2954439 RepID=A0A9D7SDS1_9BACT|nr:thiol peroxidase [Candidatus Geothrix skivensis]
MATITLNGNPTHTRGELPLPGQHTPPFRLTRGDLSEFTSVDLEGQRVLISIFPSLDTVICGESVRKFNRLTVDLPNTVMLCVSMDLPFAQSHFCGAEQLDRVLTASAFRHLDFGASFGVTLVDGPLKGLFARAVVALDENGTVVHTELVPELAREPDYDLAIHAIRNRHYPCPEDALESTE